MEEQNFDIAVIGGGPGGYVAAIRSAQLNFKTALIEREHLGGICLNWGCLPTKALLKSAEVYRSMKSADSYGLTSSGIGVDIQGIVKRSRNVAARLRQGVEYLLKKNRVTVINGIGRIGGPGKVDVQTQDGGRVIRAKHVILATGARPLRLEGKGADGCNAWTYKEAMTPEVLPQSLLVIGAGAIGVEFASFYNEMGVEVTLIDTLPQVLPGADEEISSLLEKSLERQEIRIRTSTFLKGMERNSAGITSTVESGGRKEQITTERVLLAMGVVGNTENLGLEGTKVKVNRGIIEVDEWMRTDEPGIYAIGDVAGPPCLAHKASHEGVVCVEKIAGVEHVQPLDRRKIPYCTYAHPQVATIGLSENEARSAGMDVKIGRFPFAGNGKAVAQGDSEGMVKTVFDAGTGELLGAHMIGAEVTEMIQGYGIAMNLGTTEEDLMNTIFAHPTLSEMMHEAVLAAYDRAIHI